MFGKLSSLAKKAEQAMPAGVAAQVGAQLQQNRDSLSSLPAWAQAGLGKLVEFFPAPEGAKTGQQVLHTQNQAASGFLQGTGKRRAVFIGINYTGMQGELRGCLEDVKNIHAWLVSNYTIAPQDVQILTDDQKDPAKRPTKQNILSALQWLVKDAAPGDSFFLHYSGHGGSVADADGDELDGKDETIVPLDYGTAGQITDDELNTALCKNLPEGAQVTAIFDSCHSGTVLDLPFTYTVTGDLEIIEIDNRVAAAKKIMGAVVAWNKGQKSAAVADVKESVSLLMKGNSKMTAEQQAQAAKKRETKGTVIQFAGCRDAQTSADAQISGKPTGAMSWAFMQVMNKHKQPKYTDLLREVRNLLAGQYSQVPQMSTGFQMAMDRPFSL